MRLEHVAIWANDLEKLKAYYVKYFGAKANEKYTNTSTSFSSYFLTFESGARIEIMYRPDIPDNLNDTVATQYKGIIHLAFEVETMAEVESKAKELEADGFPILKGPRKTGDGYYEIETVDPENNRLEITTLFVDK